LAFNEIWAIKNYETLKVPGYEIKSVKTKTNQRGGGVIIFGKSNYLTHEIVTPFIEGIIETTGIKSGNLVILNVYRPPNGNRQTFLDELGGLLDSLNGCDILITGDFNINFKEHDNVMINFCNQFNIKVKITGTTRLASNTCLDNFITNLSGTFSISNICIADHLAIKAKVVLQNKLRKIRVTHQYREMKEFNWQLFKNGMHNLLPTGNTVEEKWENTSNEIKRIVESSFPLKTSRQD
jgi:hypothetical protein